MGLIRSQAFSNSVISYVGIFLGYLNLAVVFPRLLPQDVLGLIQVLLSATIFISNFGSLGLQYSVIRYLPIFRMASIKQSTFFTLKFLIALFGILLTTLVLFVFSEEIMTFYMGRSALIAEYFFLLFPLSAFGILIILLDSYTRALLKSVYSAFLKEILLRILQLGAVLLFFTDFLSLLEFLWLFSALQGVYMLLLLLLLHRDSAIAFNFDFRPISKKIYSGMVRFNGISMLSSTGFLSYSSDVLIVGTFASLEAVAVYGIAVAVSRMVIVPSRSMDRVATSLISEAWAKNDLPHIVRIYEKSAITSLIIGSIIFLGIVVNIDFLISLLPQSYASGKPVILVLAFAKLIMVGTGINTGIIASSNDHWMNMVTNLISFGLMVGTGIFFVIEFGMIGAAYSAVLVELSSNLIRFSFLKVRYKMQPYTGKTIAVIALGIMAFILNAFVPHFENLILDSIVRSTIGLGGFTWLIYKLRLSKDFSEMIELAAKKAGISL